MSRKRRIFDIDMPDANAIDVGKTPDAVLKSERRGPMAAAITETAESVRERRESEAAIRRENDRLAHEYVGLRAEGQVVARIALDDVVTQKLVRDRQAGPDPELDELKTSIAEIGLSNPIRVEASGQGEYELIQGMRRLSAFRELLAETGDDAYAAIPAVIQNADDSSDTSYRKMVDENMVRKGISFGEMGELARTYAADPANDCADVDKAVAVLFKSASYTKRSYIRAFAGLLMQLDKVLEHPYRIPRNVGVELRRRMEADPSISARLSSALRARPGRTAEEEVRILRSFLGEAAARPAVPASSPPSTGKPRKPKTSFDLHHGGRVAKCAASAGRIELRIDHDFTQTDRSTLERAVAAFLKEIEG